MSTKYVSEETWADTDGVDEGTSVGDDNDSMGDDDDNALAFLLKLFGASTGLVKVVQWWGSQSGKVSKGVARAVVGGKTYLQGKVRR